MFQNVQNGAAILNGIIDITGGYFVFAPDRSSDFYQNNKPIHLGHVLKPTETYSPTRKSIQTGIYGKLAQIGNYTTASTESGSFESASVRDSLIRALWAGAVALGNGQPQNQDYVVTPKDHADVAGCLINVIKSAIHPGEVELSVYPSVILSGDGYGSGRDSTNETTLKFTYSVLAGGSLVVPSVFGNYQPHTFLGGYDVLGINAAQEDAMVQAVINAYYGIVPAPVAP